MARLLTAFGQRGLMRLGGSLVGVSLIVFALVEWWPLDLAAFVIIGLGFYMVHTGIQLFATELAPDSRASAVALHAMFFFLGQGSGPIFYGFGFAHAGTFASITIGAVIMAVLGNFLALKLRRPAAV
jgi:predicted MFS family arabinose efflux permease